MLVEVKKRTESKIDKVKLLITILCLVNEIKISETEIAVLSYYIVYKIKPETDKLLIESGVVEKQRTLRNIKSNLLNTGFLKRSKDYYNSYSLNMDSNFSADDKINLLIKIDNT